MRLDDAGARGQWIGTDAEERRKGAAGEGNEMTRPSHLAAQATRRALWREIGLFRQDSSEGKALQKRPSPQAGSCHKRWLFPCGLDESWKQDGRCPGGQAASWVWTSPRETFFQRSCNWNLLGSSVVYPRFV